MMSNEKKTEMAEYVEEQITRFLFKAKNFTIDELNYVDNFCKEFYDNNRKLMILDLIRYKTENSAVILLDEKINNLYDYFENKINNLKEENKIEDKENKKSWKGFGDK